MGYALFANSKMALTGQVNSISLMQTQRSNEQNALATQQLSLQQELSSMQANQSVELSELYQLLSKINANGSFTDEFLIQTGVAQTETKNNEIVVKHVKVKDENNEDVEKIALNEKNGKVVQKNAELELSAAALQVMDQILDDYNADVTKSDRDENLASNAREAINAKIKEKQSKFDSELADINNDIYLVGVKENVIEMEVKRLDTALSSAQKELEAVIDAEGDAIEKATPKLSGNA